MWQGTLAEFKQEFNVHQTERENYYTYLKNTLPMKAISVNSKKNQSNSLEFNLLLRKAELLFFFKLVKKSYFGMYLTDIMTSPVLR